MNAAQQKYQHLFGNLKLGVTKYGKAPHKIIMLLSILQGVRNNLIQSNQIYITPELIGLFNSIWNDLVTTQNVPNFALPFWHLKGSKNEINKKFWHPVPRSGFEALLEIKESISSLNELNLCIEYVKINDDLFDLMKIGRENHLLQKFLLERYFPETQSKLGSSYHQTELFFSELENNNLRENPEDYKAKLKTLITERKEEEIFIRGSLFKRKIINIYQNTCSISRMKIDTIGNISMVDACHISPFSESYDNRPTNGISLCPNLHRAFDRGLIAVDDNYKVIIKPNWIEEQSVYEIKQFIGKPILLPKNKNEWPDLENFHNHRNRFGF